MHRTADEPVICKCDPISQGWKPRGNRTWEMPDGRLFTFTPRAKEEVVVYIAAQYPFDTDHR